MRSRQRFVVTVAATAIALAASSFAVAAAPSWSGRWRMDTRESAGFYEGRALVLKQRGSQVTGTFSWSFAAEHGFGSPPCFTGRGGTLRGSLHGRNLAAKLVYPARGGHARATASLTATMSPNGRVIVGRGEMLTGDCSRGVYYSLRAVRIRATR